MNFHKSIYKAGITICAVLLCISLPLNANASRSSVKSIKKAIAVASLDNLIKQLDCKYERNNDDYLIYIDDTKNKVLIVITERPIKRIPNNKMVYLYTQIIKIPDSKNPSQLLLKKIAEINDNLVVGKLSLGNGGIYYNSSFWLKNADVDIFRLELQIAAVMHTEYSKVLLPFANSE